MNECRWPSASVVPPWLLRSLICAHECGRAAETLEEALVADLQHQSADPGRARQSCARPTKACRRPCRLAADGAASPARPASSSRRTRRPRRPAPAHTVIAAQDRRPQRDPAALSRRRDRRQDRRRPSRSVEAERARYAADRKHASSSPSSRPISTCCATRRWSSSTATTSRCCAASSRRPTTSSASARVTRTDVAQAEARLAAARASRAAGRRHARDDRSELSALRRPSAAESGAARDCTRRCPRRATRRWPSPRPRIPTSSPRYSPRTRRARRWSRREAQLLPSLNLVGNVNRAQETVSSTAARPRPARSSPASPCRSTKAGNI